MRTKWIGPVAVFMLVFVLSLPKFSSAEEIPADCVKLHGKLSGKIQPSVRLWAAEEAKKLHRQPTVDDARLRADILARFKGR